MTHQKRLSAPKHYPIKRKENKYVSSIKGSRSSEAAIPTVVILRDVLGYAENEKEAKKIVKQGDILRNGEEIRDIKQGIGILDVVELPELEKAFRTVRKGEYLKFLPVDDSEKVAAKIVNKREEGDRFVYRLHNGENYNTKDEFDTGNTLVFNDGVEEIELEKGNKVLVTDGKHAGETAELEEMTERGMGKDTARIIREDKEFETETENLLAIGSIEVES